MRKTYDPHACTLNSCERKKNSRNDLCCPAHWALVPRVLKLRFWAAPKIRSRYEREFQLMSTAAEILDELEKHAVVLPPDVKLVKLESELETPPDAVPRILHP